MHRRSEKVLEKEGAVWLNMALVRSPWRTFAKSADQASSLHHLKKIRFTTTAHSSGEGGERYSRFLTISGIHDNILEFFGPHLSKVLLFSISGQKNEKVQ